MYLLKENHLSYKAEHLAYCFPVIIELVIEKNTSSQSGFLRGRLTHFVTNRPFLMNEETHVSLERKPSKLVAGASSTVFACEN
jgi:hypothetical protein